MISQNCIVHGDMSMCLDAGDSLGIGSGRYEMEVTEIMYKHVREGMTVLDIGANIGYFTVLLSRLVGKNGTVHAIEAAPHNVELLKSNIEQNKLDNVVIHSAAAGATSGTIGLHISEKNNGMHRIYQSLVTGSRVVQVPLIMIDEISDLKKADFIKIDIEGAEVGAFRGMKRLLENSYNLKIIMEFSPSSIREAGNDATELIALLKQQQFEMMCIKRKNRWLDPFRPRLTRINPDKILGQLPEFNKVVDIMKSELQMNPDLRIQYKDLSTVLRERLRERGITLKTGENIFFSRGS